VDGCRIVGAAAARCLGKLLLYDDGCTVSIANSPVPRLRPAQSQELVALAE
jgi:hypothetical protein